MGGLNEQSDKVALPIRKAILIGASGFSYPGPPPRGWRGAFYPEGTPRNFDELGYYSQIFNAVEINNTFYRLPTPAIAAQWTARTPDDFIFSVKLWQKFTHRMKIFRKKSADEWETPTTRDFDEFRAGILPLAEAGKLGVLLLQYPAGFHFSPENMGQLQETLRWFYDYPKAVELRHKSWSEEDDALQALLQENRASGVLIDEPKFGTSIRQRSQPIGDMFYFRAHGRNAKAWWNPKESWEKYDYLYSRAEIKEHAQRIRSAAGTTAIKKVFAFYNNHARANAAANAIMLSQELGVRLRTMPSEAMLHRFPELAQKS
jgi:uncharacterized protein YecE (DUF72 family)